MFFLAFESIFLFEFFDGIMNFHSFCTRYQNQRRANILFYENDYDMSPWHKKWRWKRKQVFHHSVCSFFSSWLESIFWYSKIFNMRVIFFLYSLLSFSCCKIVLFRERVNSFHVSFYLSSHSPSVRAGFCEDNT